MIQYIYAQYGRERAGLAATVITYRAPLGHARGRQGLRPVRGRGRRACPASIWGWSAAASVRRDASRAPASTRPSRASPRRCALADELDRLSAPSLAARRRLRHHARPARRGRADRERARWRTAPSSNGTRTISTRSASSRSTCSALGMLTCLRKGLRSARRSITARPLHVSRRIPAEEPARLRHDLRAPIRSASSRSRAARRCRCCRG